jgi:hypothetical protein
MKAANSRPTQYGSLNKGRRWRGRGVVGSGSAGLESGKGRVPREPHQVEQSPSPLLDGRRLRHPQVERCDSCIAAGSAVARAVRAVVVRGEGGGERGGEDVV